MSLKNQLWKGQYQVRKEIGEGQYGKVFLARDVFKSKDNKHKRVAIKVLHNEEDESDSESDQEHKIFFQLHTRQQEDPSFCKGLPIIIDNGVSNNNEEFFVMERLGVSLVDILKRNRL